MTSRSVADHKDYYCRIRERYREIIGEPMDVQLGTYWTNAILEGAKTFPDFERSLMKSAGYEKRVLRLMREKCAQLLDRTDLVDAKMFQDLSRWQIGPATPESVDKFIRNTDLFKQKTKQFVETVIDGCAGSRERLGLEDIEAYTRLLIDDSEYTESRFVSDAESGHCCHEHVSSLCMSHATRNAIGGVPPKGRSDNKYGMREMFAESSASILNNAGDVADCFFEVYGRPMFVQEYVNFACAHPCCDCTDVDTWKRVFLEEKPVFHTLMNAITGLHHE